MTRRAFTIIEVLITLSLIAAIGGLAFPIMVSRTDAVVLEEATRIAESTLVRARSESVDSGEVVRVIAESRGESWALSIVRVRVSAAAASGDEPSLFGDEPDVPFIEQPEATTRIVRSIELPRGITFRTADDVGADNLAVEDDEIGFADEAARPEVEIAVFYPDGSGVMLGAVIIEVGNRAVSLSIDTWTGRVMTSDAARAPDDDGMSVFDDDGYAFEEDDQP